MDSRPFFGIDEAEIFRLLFLVAIFTLLLATLVWHMYASRKSRLEQIGSLRNQQADLEHAMRNMAEEFRNDTLRRAEIIGRSISDQAVDAVSDVKQDLEDLKKRFESVVPKVDDTHRIVSEHLEHPVKDDAHGTTARGKT